MWRLSTNGALQLERLHNPELTRHDQALFETTRRVLAEVVNEGLVRAKVEVTAPEGPGTLCLLSPQDVSWVKVGVTPGTVIEMKEDRVVSVIRPESLQPPVIVGETGNQELDPGAIFAVLSALLKDVADGTVLEAIVRELRNSATNQGRSINMLDLHPSY